jgi:integrase
LSRWQANRIVHHAVTAAGLPATKTWGTHSLRKTFCQAVYAASGYDLVATRTAMGHSHATTTERYLATNEAAAAAAIRGLEFGLVVRGGRERSVAGR